MVFSNDNLNPINSDPAIQLSRASTLAPDFIFGTKYNTQKWFFALALQNFIPLDYPIGFDSRKVLHANLSIGARFPLGKSDWELLPVMNVRYALRTPLALDIFTLADYQRKLQFGAGLRSQESLILLVRFQVLGRFHVGYSFDLVTNALRQNMAGTHEISLAISACKERKKGVSICPVFE
jgi:type IX secretion system PorP/SprF family membrane protein